MLLFPAAQCVIFQKEKTHARENQNRSIKPIDGNSIFRKTYFNMFCLKIIFAKMPAY